MLIPENDGAPAIFRTDKIWGFPSFKYTTFIQGLLETIDEVFFFILS
jgi:hypothetical protein